jgi:acyl-coenzyme A synthetase/AMP-(fatty) acid ligase
LHLVNGLGATETGLSRQFFVDHATPLEDAFLPAAGRSKTCGCGSWTERADRIEDGRVWPDRRAEPIPRRTGYWKRPDLERAAFRTDPEGGGERIYLSGDLGRLRPDGCLEHLGRTDFQLKIRGERVEPAAVEKALLEIEGIREAAVTTLEARARRRVSWLSSSRVEARVLPRPSPPFPRERWLRRSSLRSS